MPLRVRLTSVCMQRFYDATETVCICSMMPLIVYVDVL